MYNVKLLGETVENVLKFVEVQSDFTNERIRTFANFTNTGKNKYVYYKIYNSVCFLKNINVSITVFRMEGVSRRNPSNRYGRRMWRISAKLYVPLSGDKKFRIEINGVML